MFEDLSLKIWLYIPAAILIGLAALTGQVWFLVLAFIVALHIGLVSVIRESGEFLVRQKETYEAQTKFYQTVSGLSSADRYTLGLSYVPSEVLVKVDKTEVKENEFSQTWRKLPVAPYKLKVIAQAAINGERFTFRKWAGKGKLLSPAEWESLKEKMLELGLIEQANDEAAQQGFNWTGLGIDVMTQVVRDTL